MSGEDTRSEARACIYFCFCFYLKAMVVAVDIWLGQTRRISPRKPEMKNPTLKIIIIIIIHGTEQGWSFLHRDGNFGTHEKYVFQPDVAVMITDQVAKHLKSELLHTPAGYNPG